MSAPTLAKTGWWNPTPFSTRQRVIFHYVPAGGKTLCGRWQYVRGELEEGHDDHPDNCAVCKRKKAILNRGGKA